MKTAFCFTFLFLASLCSFGQIDPVVEDLDYSLLENKNIDGQWLVYKKGDNKPFTGSSTFYAYHSTKKSYRYHYNDGKLNKNVVWDTLGNITCQTIYRNDSAFTKTNTWFKNGKQRSEAVQINWQMDSTFTVWYDNGNVKETIQYRKGQWNGSWIDYDIKGNITAQGEYKNDKLIKGDQMYMEIVF